MKILNSSDNNKNNTDITHNSSSTSIQMPSNEPTQSNADTVNKIHTSITNTLTTAKVTVPTPVTNTHAGRDSCDTNDSSASVVSCDDDLYYYETQPRSLAALAERDRRREQLYLQKLTKKQEQQSVNNTSTDRNVLVEDSRGMSIQANAIDSSSAMIVSESRASCENYVTPNRATSDNVLSLSAPQTVKTATINKSRNLNLNNANFKRNFCARPNSVGGEDIQIGKNHKMDNKSYNSAINVPVSTTTTAATGKSASCHRKSTMIRNRSLDFCRVSQISGFHCVAVKRS